MRTDKSPHHFYVCVYPVCVHVCVQYVCGKSQSLPLITECFIHSYSVTWEQMLSIQIKIFIDLLMKQYSSSTERSQGCSRESNCSINVFLREGERKPSPFLYNIDRASLLVSHFSLDHLCLHEFHSQLILNIGQPFIVVLSISRCSTSPRPLQRILFSGWYFRNRDVS